MNHFKIIELLIYSVSSLIRLPWLYTLCRYIEIFRSSLAEARLASGPKMRSGFSMNQRHAPYDRNERFGGMNRYSGMSSRSSQRSFRGGKLFKYYYFSSQFE